MPRTLGGVDCIRGEQAASGVAFPVSGSVSISTTLMAGTPPHCSGLAASMGSILLSVGEKGKRFIQPHAKVMIHQPSGGAQGQASNIEIQAKEIIKTKEIGARILADNCGQDFEKVMKDFDRDYWMDAKESVAYGIVDGILE